MTPTLAVLTNYFDGYNEWKHSKTKQYNANGLLCYIVITPTHARVMCDGQCLAFSFPVTTSEALHPLSVVKYQTYYTDLYPSVQWYFAARCGCSIQTMNSTCGARPVCHMYNLTPSNNTESNPLYDMSTPAPMELSDCQIFYCFRSYLVDFDDSWLFTAIFGQHIFGFN